MGRGKGPLPPFVSMMPVVPPPNGAPRFVESTHGQDGGWMGPLYHPMRIDADASKPDYRVGEFNLRAEVPYMPTNAEHCSAHPTAKGDDGCASTPRRRAHY